MEGDEKKEVSEAIGRFLDAVRNQDIQALSRVVAQEPGVIFYGSQAGDKEVGWEGIQSSFIEQFSETGGISNEVLDSAVSVVGDLAWGAYDLRYTENLGSKEESFETRWTCILKRYEDGWKLVHMHHSMGR